MPFWASHVFRMLSPTAVASALRSRMRTAKTASGLPVSGSTTVSYAGTTDVDGATSIAVCSWSAHRWLMKSGRTSTSR